MKIIIGRTITALLLAAAPVITRAADSPTNDSHANLDQLVEDTHNASLKLREDAVRKTIAKDICWPGGLLGDDLWTLSALYLNEKVDEANARLLLKAQECIAAAQGKAPATPDQSKQPGLVKQAEKKVWTAFDLNDPVRSFYLFNSKSPFFPGRLKPETETAMKEAFFLVTSNESRIADLGSDNLLVLRGTENHDLMRRPSSYLVTALLKEDPAYRDRKLADGHTIAEHADAYTAFFREWPRRRAETGLWVEVGANGYQKYSWTPMFNLYDLSPDPLIRHRFGLLLDLAFIEEEQISVNGRRGGGRSRAYPGVRGFEYSKNLLFASKGQPGDTGVSRLIETSRYQLPPEAIYLRKQVFPATAPFVIRNRVLGELEMPKPGEELGFRLAADSALVNYAYRTPHYLLGSTLQNPALSMPDPKTGAPTLKYAPISRQNRACGMLFDAPAGDEICSVDTFVGHGKGGRPQHSFWSVQHENVLILQRIASQGGTLGSYSTDAVGINFAGKALQKVEEGGWIFASNGNAFVGVKFLDGPYVWDEKHVLATPAKFDPATDKSRILLHAGDIASHGTFDKFKADVLASSLNVTAEKVDYRFGPAATNHLEVALYDAKVAERFSLPLINGKRVDLRPAKTYQSPYLNADFGSDKISVNVGPVARVLDFSEQGQEAQLKSR